MGKRLNIIAAMQRWMDSVPGQTFMQYAYSWGAAVVILGTLFKLTHLPGANFMLFVGMGTEVFVFFVAGFERPFDRRKEEPDLANDVDESILYDDEPDEVPAVGIAPATGVTGVVGGGTIIIGGLPAGGSANVAASAPVNGEVPATSATPAATTNVDAAALKNMAAACTGTLQAAASTVSPEMEEATAAYVDELKKLTDTLAKVSEQSVRLTRDSEEMEQLNRTLTGINTIYEMQLKSISTQVGTIDQINDQTRRMAQQIEELNGVYARMIQALTVNMKNAASAGA